MMIALGHPVVLINLNELRVGIKQRRRFDLSRLAHSNSGVVRVLKAFFDEAVELVLTLGT